MPAVLTVTLSPGHARTPTRTRPAAVTRAGRCRDRTTRRLHQRRPAEQLLRRAGLPMHALGYLVILNPSAARIKGLA
jgi:hypothetical protein